MYFMRYFFRNYAKYRDFIIYFALFFLWITAILLYVNTLVWLTFVCLNCIIECKLVHLRMIPVGVFFLCTGSCIHHAAVRSGSDSCHIPSGGSFSYEKETFRRSPRSGHGRFPRSLRRKLRPFPSQPAAEAQAQRRLRARTLHLLQLQRPQQKKPSRQKLPTRISTSVLSQVPFPSQRMTDAAPRHSRPNTARKMSFWQFTPTTSQRNLRPRSRPS